MPLALLASLVLAVAVQAPPSGVLLAVRDTRADHLAPDTARCAEAARFARNVMAMTAIVSADTLDDWRTRQRLPGCRITAAGASRRGVGAEAIAFFERLRQHGWARTPDPQDAPNESSLRFRRAGTDCLFNVYGEPRLFTDEEFRVVDAVTPGALEQRWFLLGLCAEARASAPR